MTLAHKVLPLIQPAHTFLDRSSELVQLALEMSGDGLEKAYATILASDQYSSVAKERLRQCVEESGGIRPFVESGTSRGKSALADVQERGRRLLETETEGGGGGTGGGEEGGGTVGPSANGLFQGGIAAIGVGVAATLGGAGLTAASAAGGPATGIPGAAVGQALFYFGGFMIGAGLASVILSFVTVEGNLLPENWAT